MSGGDEGAGLAPPLGRRPGRSPAWPSVLGGAVFLSSGAALVTHVLTGAPLALVLALLVTLGGGLLALALGGEPATRRAWSRRVGVGVAAGLTATAAYDASRWLLVLVAGWQGDPFAAFPLFGQALLGDGVPEGSRLAAGAGFHLLNGCAFGVAFTVWFGTRPWWWGIGFALGLEAFMLAIYPGWLDPRSLAEFTQVSLLGHLAYGTVLGLAATRWLREHAPPPRGPGVSTG